MTKSSGNIGRPRLLYVVTEDWYFLSHRLPMARAALQAGFEVHVATNIIAHRAEIERLGFVMHDIPFTRGRLSIHALRTIFELRRLYNALKPQIIHHVALQPIVLGGLAAIGLSAFCLHAITGSGYVFTTASSKARFVRSIVAALLVRILNRPRTMVLVQNPDDRMLLLSLGVKDRIVLIAGSGVDVARFKPLPETAGPITIGFVGRLLEIKGIRTLMAAHKLLQARNVDVNLLIAGAPDPANPGSISQNELGQWKSRSGVSFMGQVDDIEKVWSRAHIAVLPSQGGEGVPMSLLEAAACGRPLIATDVPGCREIVVSNKTGILVPVNDPEALAAAIEKLFASAELRLQFGEAARRLVAKRFSAEVVEQATKELYSRLMPPPR
jgi:glycosyltransferase involved in cell wall biosynthesis